MKLTANTILSYTNFFALTNNIMDLAQEIMPDKVIYINFLNDEVQVTLRVSKNGTRVNVHEGVTIPVNEAICNTIDYKNGRSLVLGDIRNNDFDDKVNKTINELNVGSYLGIPVSFKNGTRFGTLCAAHHDKSEFNEREVKLLENIANLFSFYLELEFLAYRDPLTNLQNKQFLFLKEDYIVKHGGLLVMLDLDNFKLVNDTFGHDVGDEVLKEVGRKIDKATEKYGKSISFRLGGDEFLIYSESPDEAKARTLVEQLMRDLRVWETTIGSIALTSSIGAFVFAKGAFRSFDEASKHVDELLYEAKRSGKNTFLLEKFQN